MGRSLSTTFARYPALCIGIALAAGISIATLFALAAAIWFLTAGALVVLAALLRRRQIAGPLAVMLAAGCLGAGLHQLEASNVSGDRVKAIYDDGTILSGSPVTVEG